MEEAGGWCPGTHIPFSLCTHYVIETVQTAEMERDSVPQDGVVDCGPKVNSFIKRVGSSRALSGPSIEVSYSGIYTVCPNVFQPEFKGSLVPGLTLLYYSFLSLAKVCQI